MANPYAPPQAVVQDIPVLAGTTEPAGRGARLGAALLDGLVFGVMVYGPFMAGVIAVVAMNPPEVGAEPDPALFGLAMLAALPGFLVWLWLTLRFMMRNSQSIGKKLVGIKVVRSDGSPISLSRLIWLRNVVNWLVSIVPLYGFIDPLFIFGERQQCLHDRLADTIVVNA